LEDESKKGRALAKSKRRSKKGSPSPTLYHPAVRTNPKGE
jgi:hypothetical protein